MNKNISDKIIDACLWIVRKLLDKEMEEETIIVFVSKKEWEEFKEFRDNIFIVYENEQQLKEDFPNAKVMQ